MKVNLNKTRILSLKEYSNFCKWNIKLFNNGKVTFIPVRKTIYRQRRKIRKMYELYRKKRIRYSEIEVVKVSFNTYLNIGNSYKYIIIYLINIGLCEKSRFLILQS